MTSTTDPRLVTAAETARLLGVTRQRILELAAAATGFPAAEPTATGGRMGPRGAVQAWAATHPDPGPVVTGPDVPPDYGHPRQIWAVMNRAASEARELNHPWIGDDHLMLGMLHPDCPGTGRRVLESPASQLVLERANLEAARLADAEVASEHVLLALVSRGHFPPAGSPARGSPPTRYAGGALLLLLGSRGGSPRRHVKTCRQTNRLPYSRSSTVPRPAAWA
jgi:hypothetical protein